MFIPLSVDDFIGSIASITTIFQFLSGILVCKQYVYQTTGEASALPFICGVLSSFIWLFYGWIKNDHKIVLVNTVGVTLMTMYTFIFYKYTFKKSTTLKQIFGTVSMLLMIFFYISTESNNERLTKFLGLLACIVTLLTIAAPMSKLLHVYRVKSTECLPFPIILMSFFVSVLWCFYGILKEDIFLVVPNLVGIVLSVSQLMLFVIYPSNSELSVSNIIISP